MTIFAKIFIITLQLCFKTYIGANNDSDDDGDDNNDSNNDNNNVDF